MTATNRHTDWFSIFRILFGLLMMFGAFRFWYNDWIEQLYIIPAFHFTFSGFEFVAVPPQAVMYLLFGLMFLCGFAIAVNFQYRIACVLFFFCFTYVELIDVTYYLNHYYLVSVLSFLLIFYNSRRPSTDLYNKRVLFFLKLQISIVYFFGGINKIESDWLLSGQPLKIWLYANGDFPVIGSTLMKTSTAMAAAWLSMLFDIGVAFLLWMRKTRFIAYIILCIFHVFTALLFNIGLFPWIMMTAALLFFTPAASLQELFSFSTLSGRTAVTVFTLCVLAIWQLVFPLRHFFHPGNYLWTEKGFRFSWNIMLMEKNGIIEFAVVRKNGRLEDVNELAYLTPFQLKMMSTQPDLILQFAHHLEQEYRRKGIPLSQVRAMSQVSLNGRTAKEFFETRINLLNGTNELYSSILLSAPRH